MPPDLKRDLLGVIGLGLEDEAYVLVIAGMGVAYRASPSSLSASQQFLTWTPRNFLAELKKLGDRPHDTSVLVEYQTKWHYHLGSSNRRAFLLEDEFGAGTPDLIAIVKLLNHSASLLKSVAIEKNAPQADLRWQWPLRIAALPKDFQTLALEKLRATWPAKELVEVLALTRELTRCEVLVISGTAREALRRVLELPYRIRASHILLIGPIDVVWPDLRSHVDTLLSETQAGALSLVSLPTALVFLERLNDWVRELSHNEPFDVALTRAFPRESSSHFMDLRLLDHTELNSVARNLGRRLRELATNVPLPLPKGTPKRINLDWTTAEPAAKLGNILEKRAHILSFDRESHGATGLKEKSVAERKSRREAALSETRRILQGDLFGWSDGASVPVTQGLVVGKRYQLDIFIGPPGEGAISADGMFPDNELNWQVRDSYTLQVLFTEFSQWDKPFRGTLELPREGTSSKCLFVFSPTRTGSFAGRITLYYRGRVLQTALLKTDVVKSDKDLKVPRKSGPLRFIVESEIRRSLSTLDDRRRFDAFLLLNHTTTGASTMTAAGKEGAYIASLDGIAPQLAAINALLNQVALDSKPYKKGLLVVENAKLLCDLAAEGHWIYRNLVLGYINHSSAAQALREAKYLQIVSTHLDAIVPLEFVYDYPRPKGGAPVCKNAIQALKDGHCPASCKPDQSPAPHVCPLGFWGLSKVIERHPIDPALSKPAKVKTEPIEGRDRLSLKGSSLLATSKEVPAADRNSLEKNMKTALKSQVVMVRSWEDWRKTVQTNKPVLLLALPHAGGSGAHISLEINGDVLESDYINEDYVRVDSAKPIVLLLGCDMANTAFTDAYAKHVAVFREAQAALVLGTVATVLGKDAATVGTKLIAQLAATSAKSAERFGEVLRQVKRESVAESLMIAMCLVAFGDADWRLK